MCTFIPTDTCSVSERPSISFPHQLFLEYFAACHAARHGIYYRKLARGGPTSYFMTAFSAVWKRIVWWRSYNQKAEYCEEYGSIQCSWIYKVDDQPYHNSLSGTKYFSEITGSNSNFDGCYLKQLKTKFPNLVEKVQIYENITFDDNFNREIIHSSDINPSEIRFDKCEFPSPICRCFFNQLHKSVRELALFGTLKMTQEFREMLFA